MKVRNATSEDAPDSTLVIDWRSREFSLDQVVKRIGNTHHFQAPSQNDVDIFSSYYLSPSNT